MIDPRRLVPMEWRARIADLSGRGPFSVYANEQNFIFIHIPKTAGVSISRALLNRELSHKDYREYLEANPRKFRFLFKFTFVRNPWDRLVSSYFFLKSGGMSNLDEEWAKKNLGEFDSFREFVHQWVNAENVWSWIHFKPQHYFVADDEGLVMVDFVGRFESIASDFAYVAERLGRQVRLPVSNSSSHADYRTYYDDETRRIVAEAYHRDIELFRYDFGS